MKIGLYDSDNTSFPNLALMKLSSACKSMGYDVGMYIDSDYYDVVYVSRVFSFTEEPVVQNANLVLRGGAFHLDSKLDDRVEHIMPDYSLYDLNYSVGFLTRGCPNKCSWCSVPKREGSIRAHADISEFLHPEHKEVVLLDNNVLASDHGIQQIEKISRLKVKVDFNQGMDARLIDSSISNLFSKVKWKTPVRLACDTMSQIEPVRKAIELLRWHNVTPSRYFCYVLVEDVDEALERVKFLKSMYVDPFAQPYLDLKGTPPTIEQRRFARWVNHKAMFKTMTWEVYNSLCKDGNITPSKSSL